MTPIAEQRPQLAEHLAALPEPAMREACLIAYLSEVDAEQSVESLECIRSRVASGPLSYRVALNTWIGVLCKGYLAVEQVEALYNAACMLGYHVSARFLLVDEESSPSLSPERFAPQPLTLGHRVSQAKATNRRTITRLLQFPEPAVIRILLQNPRLTERDVVRLAARRKANPLVQFEIFYSDRWIYRPQVRRALVYNLNTPASLSHRLLAVMSSSELVAVTKTPALSRALREFATEILAALKVPSRAAQAYAR